MQAASPWLPRFSSDCTLALACARCPAVFCFGRGATAYDEGFIVGACLYINNVVSSEMGLCWCRCGLFVGLRHLNYVILHKFRVRHITSSLPGPSDWVNSFSVNEPIWMCKSCNRLIGWGSNFERHIVDPLYLTNAVYCETNASIVKCICGSYLGYHDNSKVILGEIVRYVQNT